MKKLTLLKIVLFSAVFSPFLAKGQAVIIKNFSDFPLVKNTPTKNWIRYYQTSGRDLFRNQLERSYKYLPAMRSVLAQNHLPKDLVYMALIESGFKAHAVSPSKAVGYWQFIPSTAQFYNLKINKWVDERKDFMKSTRAAAKYLRNLKTMFGDWYLATAAYNMGENKLNRLIKRYGSKNFWYLSRKPGFPSETREYVPKLIAAIFVAKAPGLYGFRNLKEKSMKKYDYAYVPGGTDIFALAMNLNENPFVLQELNPELKTGMAPPSEKKYPLRLPKKMIQKISKKSL